MNTKKLTTIFGMFAFIFLSLTLVSAASLQDITVSSIPTEVAHDADSFQITFDLTNAGLESDLDWTSSAFSQGTGSFLFSHNHINDGSVTPATISVTATINFDEHQSGNIAGTITADPETGSAKSLSFSVPITEEKALTITKTQELTKTQNAIITIENTGNTNLNSISLEVVTPAVFEVAFSKSNFNLGAGASTTVEVSSAELANLELGDDTTLTLKATDGTLNSNILTLEVPVSFCRFGEVGGEDLEVSWIKDKSGLDKDWEWRPLDDLEIDVKVRNNAEEDLDITVKLMLVDENGKEVADFVEDEEDLEQDESVDEGKSVTLTFNFQISAEVQEGTSYNLIAKVFEEGDEDVRCSSLIAEEEDNKENIKIDKKKHEVLVKEVKSQETATCDSFIELEAKVYNIGEEDQDKVKVTLYNQELGINMEKELNDLSEGDWESVNFGFSIPKDAEEKLYRFTFSTEYDYDDKDDEYDKQSPDEDDFKHTLTVLGSCAGTTTTEPTITANLLSDAEVGKELKIQVSVKNNGDDDETFVISANNFETWAELVNIESQVMSIGAGETKQATIVFTPTQSGTQTFNVKAGYSGKTSEQLVQVSVTGKSGGFLTGAFAGLGDSGLYVISAVFLILIIIIIILIVKVSGGSAPSDF